MTEDVDGGSTIPLLNPSAHLASTVTTPADVCTSISQLEGALYLNPGLTIDGSCLYTAADLAGNFPEGTVLQILPDSTILAVPSSKEQSSNSLNNTTVIYKDSSFSTELNDVSSATEVPNLLVETNDQSRSLGSEVPIYSEGNISDIDLSFLNETEEAVADPLVKDLNDSAVKECQEAAPIAPTQTLNVTQNNLSSNAEDSQGLHPEIPKESEGSTDGVVMIDVSKPIQLSQNSLIMVNGQKCVLQHDPHTGQVIAYPVKEQEKPRRKRGRPRKSSVDLNSKEASVNSELSPAEPETTSDEGKGLLEIVTDDGALVRRSTRKRKKAKVLKDYETGNLKQELGSDLDEPETLDNDPELHSRKKKLKGPGRPRKFPPVSVDASSITETNGVKRQRGRPRKQAPENEPTQAFLVQTADGQTLMMQVPLSSIPPGVTLQEVAQNIANRLNVGLSQTNSPPIDFGNILQPEQKSNITNVVENTSEPAVQDHSIGSTTNLSSVDQFSKTTESVQIEAESSQQNIPTNKDDIIVDSVGDSQVREIILQEENNTMIPSPQTENLLQNPAQFSNLEIPQCSEENFSLNIPTSNSASIITSSLATLPENLNDQSKPEDIEVSFNQFEIPKDFLISGDFMKGKMNLNQLLHNVVNTSSSQLSDSCIDKAETADTKDISTPGTQVQFILNESNNLKDFENDFVPSSVKAENAEDEKQFISQEMTSLDNSEKLSKNFDFLNCDITNSNIDSSTEKDSSQTNSIMDSIVHDHNLLIQSQPMPEKCETAESSVEKPNAGANKKMFQPILPLEKATIRTVTTEGTIISVPGATVVPVSSNQQLQLTDKMLPIILSPQELPGAQKCKVCQKPYFTEEEIIKHFKAVHPKCICNQCNYMAEHAYVIKRHSIRHIENGVICDICGKRYKDNYILKMHIKMVHMPAEVMFTCEICDKKFTRKAHLKRHLRIHAPHRPFKCPFCSYRGCEKSDITKHLLIHEAPKHKCERCGKAFRHLKNKELHVKRHKKQRDYKCGICEFYGYTFTDIRKHIERRHTDAKTSTCLDCGLVFKSKDELEKHKSSGSCQLTSESNLIVMEGSVVSLTGKNETKKPLEMHLDILGEASNSQESNPSENLEEKVSLVQPNQLILSSDKITNLQNGQIVVSGLEGVDLFPPENLTLLPVGSDSNKLITLISADGRNFALPLKDLSSTNLEGVIATPDKKTSSETYFLSEFEPETTT